MSSSASSIPAIARLIGQSGAQVQNLFNTHSHSYEAIDHQLQIIINGVAQPSTVLGAAQAIGRVTGVPSDVANYAKRIEDAATGPASEYNSTHVLALVSAISAYLADKNTNILEWLTSLNPSS